MKNFEIEQLLEVIQENGYVELTGLIPTEHVERINAIVERPLSRMSLNGRKGYIQSANIRYLQHTLSWGKDILDIYTHPLIIELCDKYADSEVHLSNYRIYRTLPSRVQKMNWHLDNKTDEYDAEHDRFVTKVVSMDKGIIMIMYLSDVEDGGFQIVEGSHRWDVQEERETFDDMEKEFQSKIVTFNNRPKGTLLVYDYRCIHRAKPYSGGKIRTSLFGQYSPSWMPTGEPVILNAADIADLNDRQKRVLNFGKKPTTENWPVGKKEEVISEIGVQSVFKYLAKKILK